MAKMEFVGMTLPEIREKADGLAVDYTESIKRDSISETNGIGDNIKSAVEKYTEISRNDCYDKLLASDDPMMAAVKQLTFKTISAKDETVKGTKDKVRKIVEVEKSIDLRDLWTEAGRDRIGKDKQWIYAAEKLNCLITARACKMLGVSCTDVRNNIYMQDISREYDLGNDVTSNKKLLKALGEVIAMMVGEKYKPLTIDVNYLLFVYGKKGKKALSVACADHRQFTALLMEICHRIVTGGHYEVEFKKNGNK